MYIKINLQSFEEHFNMLMNATLQKVNVNAVMWWRWRFPLWVWASFRLSCADGVQLCYSYVYLFSVSYVILLMKNMLYFCTVSVLVYKRNRENVEMSRTKVHWSVHQSNTPKVPIIFFIHFLWSRFCFSSCFTSSFFPVISQKYWNLDDFNVYFK